MRYLLFVVLAFFWGGCGSSSSPTAYSFIKDLEQENGIDYDAIVNTRASYITLMCYTKTKDADRVYNPCYSCHNKSKPPNYFNETDLQEEYNFPQEAMVNHFTNAFKDRSQEVAKISDEEILRYIRSSNYIKYNEILLAKRLPKDWQGYRPDCYFHFDQEGFDHAPDGNYTGWRAFRYYPFLGTFWPTNGSTDDVLIRLPKRFQVDKNGKFDKEIYELNLAIVEALIKRKDIRLPSPVDEKELGVDLDADGVLAKAKSISPNIVSYVGNAKSDIHIAQGLFPVGTEFLHSVRYIDWDEEKDHVKMAARMKELRYAKKTRWLTYSELEDLAWKEQWEAETTGNDRSQLEIFTGDYEHGLRTGSGWVYQGFIEDKKGELRPQTKEETINCMGCHARVSVVTDTIYSFPRKFNGVNISDKLYGWGHWSQKDLSGVPEPKAKYEGVGEVYEYSFYLQNNHSGNEFRDNDEVIEKFFDKGTIKEQMLQKLHKDVTLLLYPSKRRALMLDKAYKVIVDEQSFIYGRAPHVRPMKNLYKKFDHREPTGIERPIVLE